ncbi:hypothetical protein KPC83_04410 [Collinsella sp. zg1085]|uniref:hypothetical protein n=1 Tax=Collinsella sp. zg1085 TaxID=2844380 RepID=UPI001C0DA397|nr:hypothetical protein [Collinsella sp. zg1085]QWT17094.1 hypothetical protein KPC83_04410 [Collinsella sp. zg1085]
MVAFDYLLYVPHILIYVFLGYASYRDSIERRFPHGLAGIMCLLALSTHLIGPLYFLLLGQIIGSQAFHMVVASLSATLPMSLLITLALIGIELLWRHVLGQMGMGMGDIKLIGILSIINPYLALISLAGGLMLSALVCLVMRRKSFPAIPGISIGWLLSNLSMMLLLR